MLYFVIFVIDKRSAMKKIIMISLMLALAFSASAQILTFVEPDEQSIGLFDSVKFVNPNYANGIVVFKDSKQSTGIMNICTIDQKVYFITSGKDTLVLKDNDNVNRVFIKGKTYLNTANGYVEVLDLYEDVLLGQLQRIDFLENVQTGAYGQKRQNATVQRVNYIDASGYRIDLNSKNVKPFSYTKAPYIQKGNGQMLPVTKKNLMKCFPKKKDFIEAYIDEHKPNLNAIEPVQEFFKALAK